MLFALGKTGYDLPPEAVELAEFLRLQYTFFVEKNINVFKKPINNIFFSSYKYGLKFGLFGKFGCSLPSLSQVSSRLNHIPQEGLVVNQQLSLYNYDPNERGFSWPYYNHINLSCSNSQNAFYGRGLSNHTFIIICEMILCVIMPP